jgi:phosphoribosylaminoimidazolecarboxamide formyltransferase/IMP cyclohydrolase
MDSDAAIELAGEFADRAAAVIIKHTNPCGVACITPSTRGGNRDKGGSALLAEAFIRARDCDPTSAFGGIVTLTRAVDEATAKAIGDTFFEVIIAPKFEAKALEVLKAKKNLRLLEIPVLDPRMTPASSPEAGQANDERRTTIYDLRKVRGGLLVQDYDDIATDVRKCMVVTRREPTKDELTALDFAWRVVKHVKSNAIVIAGPGPRLLGVGAGQTSRVDSVRIAIEKMNALHPTPFPRRGERRGEVGTFVLASDAFFPFRDGIDLAAKAGVTAIIQPGGSIRDEEAVKAADENGMAMMFTAVRHFRH